MNSKLQMKRCVLMTLDPVHIGTGGYRLGRVDATIAREPGTKLPKIPGTSLHGAIRHYAAYRYDKPQCAGQSSKDKGHCGQSSCPICYTFGSAKSSEDHGYAGVVNISDARILFFPVNSMFGPVWISTKNMLQEVGIDVGSWPDNAEAWTSIKGKKSINLGWLMLTCENGLNINLNSLEENNEFKAIKERLVLVKEEFFSRIVNSNLEVRTSVSIDPQTGAATEGALYTYEAIPRATFLWMDIVIDDYRNNSKINGETEKKQVNAWEVVTTGLDWMEYLGVGGMGTRGFGRLRKVSGWGCEDV